MNDLKDTVLDLIRRPVEEEWFEFKENWYEAHELGEYISALSNAAAYEGATTAQKAVRRLREGGYIERVGSNKSGWWRVL